MLCLLNLPAWAPEGATPQPLPTTLPGALLLVLAVSEGWQPRERLAALLWPDSEPTDALHHLRINLHRSRKLLRQWGVEGQLQSQGSHLRLDLSIRLGVGEAGDPDAPPPDPQDWPRGWHLPGHESLAQWLAQTAQELRRRWLQQQRRPALAPDKLAPAAAPPARAAEHAQLRTSAAPALLLMGEPGAGKSTLLRAAFPHAPCLRGLEGLHGMPYRPLLDALRAQRSQLETILHDPQCPLRPYRLDLARVLPELAPDEPLPPLDALSAQARLAEALTLAFEALTPVLLVDDLQWCDSATVEWLLMLAHGHRLRWRAAVRSHEMSPALQQALLPLESGGRLERMALQPLPHGDLAAVCGALWPERRFTEAELTRLHAASAGNAFALGELVAAGTEALCSAAGLPERVQQMVQRRLNALGPLACQAIEAAAVAVQPLPEAGLRMMLGLSQSDMDDAAWRQARAEAMGAGMLSEMAPGLACSHDLIRHATLARLTPPRRLMLHRHAALWLAQQAGADAMTIAEHWRAAGEPQTALAWRHQGAQQLKARGRFDEACSVWREVADESLDMAQALRAQLELAACDLLEDLARGEAALEAVQAQLGAVADPELHQHIEGRLRAALVDNRVFAGDIATAARHAARLRELLPALPEKEQLHALEVLIELAMREPDIPGAWAMLARLRALAPRQPTLLSFEGQIHWFGGQVRAAHEALARLLERHPDYCRGITVENDIAVMLQALGEPRQAEAMARRSLQSWAGVAHTETLSLLVLGSALTSQGRHAEAETALLQALRLSQAQSSAGFEAEARLRLARLLLQCGQVAEAALQLAAVAPLVRDSREPLRVSNWVLTTVLCAAAQGLAPEAQGLQRLREASSRLQHPLVQAREARVHTELALLRGDAPAAVAAAEQQARIARGAGLQEWAAEASLLQLRARQLAGESPETLRPLAAEAETLANQQGFADLGWRAAAWLSAHGGTEDDARRALAALTRLQGSGSPSRFDADAAARQEPRPA